MDLGTVKAKLATGELPQARDVTVRFVRYASGVCVGCEVTFGTSDVGVQFESGNETRLLHPDCYVMWTEACAD